MTTFDFPLKKKMKHCHYFLSVLIVLFVTVDAYSQSIRDTTLQMSTIDFSIGGHMPAGDLADRFGEKRMAVPKPWAIRAVASQREAALARPQHPHATRDVSARTRPAAAASNGQRHGVCTLGRHLLVASPLHAPGAALLGGRRHRTRSVSSVASHVSASSLVLYNDFPGRCLIAS